MEAENEVENITIIDEPLSQLGMIYEDELDNYTESSVSKSNIEKTFTNMKSNTFVKSNLTLPDDMISKTIREESSGGIQIYNIEILRKGNIKPTISTAGFGIKEKDDD